MSEEQKKQIKSIHFKTKSLQPPVCSYQKEFIWLGRRYQTWTAFQRKIHRRRESRPKTRKRWLPFPKRWSCNQNSSKVDYNFIFFKKKISIVWTIVKEVGNRLLEGQDLISTPLPVIIFEKRSLLERICDHWCRIDLLSKAASMSKIIIKVVLIFIRKQRSSWKI